MVMMQPFRMTPVYDLLLRGTERTPVGLYHLQVATAAQLCRLHYSPGSITAVKARLKTLTNQGYIQADSMPTKFYKSPYYYTLGDKGIAYLAAAGFDVHDAFRASKEVEKSFLFLEHTKELNDVLISAALIQRADPHYHLESFTHERVLKRQPFRVKSGNHTLSIIPDAFLEFRLTTPEGQRRMPVFLEHDRGTEEQQYFRRRIRGYITLLKTDAFHERFGIRTITVAFTTFQGEKRLKQMRTWTEEELKATHEPWEIGSAFLFAALPEAVTPEQAWLEPRWHLASPSQSTGHEPSPLLATP